MTSMNQSQIDRLRREIARFQKDQSEETRKEANLQAKLNRTTEAASRAKSPSTVISKLKEQERVLNDLSRVQNKQADLSKKIADKSRDLHMYEDRKAREDEKERRKIADEQKRLMRENMRNMNSGSRVRSNAMPPHSFRNLAITLRNLVVTTSSFRTRAKTRMALFEGWQELWRLKELGCGTTNLR